MIGINKISWCRCRKLILELVAKLLILSSKEANGWLYFIIMKIRKVLNPINLTNLMNLSVVLHLKEVQESIVF